MKNFIMTLRKQNKLYTLITVAVLAAALFFVFRIIYAGVIALPYPKEILEPSNIALTDEFLAGNSPYTIKSLSRSVPGVNYDYPPLGSIIAAGIAWVTGCTAVTAHFFISVFSILVSGVIGFIWLADDKRAGGTTVAPVLAALIFMFCHFRYGYISAAPDDPGLLLLLLTCAAAVSLKTKNKPVICAAGITLCFYTKQYFVFVVAGLFVYMLLYSRKEAIKLFVWTVVFNVSAAAVITICWPLYWTKAFFFTYLGTAVGGGGKISTLTDQFVYILTIFGPLFIFIIAAAVKMLIDRNRNKEQRVNDRAESGKIKENDVFAMSAVQSVVMIIPLFIIGRNDGAFLSYFLQLWIPFVTIVALTLFEKMRVRVASGHIVSQEAAEYKSDHQEGQNTFGGSSWHIYVYPCIYAAAAAFIVYFGFARLPLHILTQEEISDWQRAQEYIQKYSEQGEVHYARCLAYEASLTAGECICGHDGEVNTDTVAALTDAGLPDPLIQYARQIVDQNLAYRKEIEEKAADHGYSLITFDNSGAYTAFSEAFCEENGYRCLDRIDLRLGNMPYEVLFYIPN